MKYSTEWMGFEISGNIIIGDYEGDSSIPDGIRCLDDYVDDLSIKLGDVELCGMNVFTAEFEDRCAGKLIKESK